MDQGLLRRLANLCKTYYVNRTIDDLFFYAGADRSWWVQVNMGEGERVTRFYGWVEGIKTQAPDQLPRIVEQVSQSILQNESIPSRDKEALRSTLPVVEEEPEDDGTIKVEPLLSTVARMLAQSGRAREVAVLASSKADLSLLGREDWTYIDHYRLALRIPYKLYVQIEEDKTEIEKIIESCIDKVLVVNKGHVLDEVTIAPDLVDDNRWRDKAAAWLAGEGVNNQGRVRSNNVASKTRDGLLFRSNEEINLYNALKAFGVTFAPLPVFLRGGSEYRRIEPDFVIIKSGVVMVVEVDGDTVHHESPADADARTTLMEKEGVYVLHVSASECKTPELATACAKKVLERIISLKEARR